jgi:hypothetical protein
MCGGGWQTSYLLLHGELPNTKQMAGFDREVRKHMLLKTNLLRFFDHFPVGAHPMVPPFRLLPIPPASPSWLSGTAAHTRVSCLTAAVGYSAGRVDTTRPASPDTSPRERGGPGVEVCAARLQTSGSQ